jgi:16S rRNA (adenine(1408)-N(1))-methyltransferase
VSLLRGCVGADELVAAGVAGLVADGGTLELLLAPSSRDGLDGVPTEATTLADAVSATFVGRGFEVVLARPATGDEIAASGSTWARRLGAGRSNGAADRIAVLVRLSRR